MLSIKKTTLLDGSSFLDCVNCIHNYNCKTYVQACKFRTNGSVFAARLLCTIQIAERASNDIGIDSEAMGYKFCYYRAKNVYECFLPKFSQLLTAFYKYDVDNNEKEIEKFLIKTLAERLEFWNVLELFDTCYGHNVKKLYERFSKQQLEQTLKNAKNNATSKK